MKKSLSIFLCLVMVLSVFTIGFATDGSGDAEAEERCCPPPHQVTLTISIEGEGTTTPEEGVYDDYTHNACIEVTATPAECWEFDHWEGDIGAADPNLSTIIVLMHHSDKEITAVFRPILYDLSVTHDEEGTTDPEGTITVTCGTVVYIAASPSSVCWEFDQWEGDFGENSATDPSINVTMDMDRDIHATFKIIQYTLGISHTEGGTTTPEPGDHDYDCGTVVDLTASPSSCWKFDHWEGDVASSGSATTTVTMGSHQLVEAVFVEDTCPCDEVELYVYVQDGDGVASPAGISLRCVGDEVDLLATPDQGWEFVTWQGDPVNDPSEESTSIIIPEGGATVGAVFAPIATPGDCTLTVTHEGDGYTVPSGATVVSCGTVDLKAYAEEGWAFKYWEGAPVADMYDPMTTITVTTDSAVHAVFEDQYCLCIEIEGNGETDPAEGENYYSVTSPAIVVDLDTDADSGWYFYRWEGPDAGDISSGEIVMDGDKDLVAVFRRRTSSSSYGGIFIQHTLSITVEGNGTVDPFVGSKKYMPGTIVDLGVDPAAGWTFVGWLGPDGADVVNEQIEMDDDKTLIARFEGSSPPVEPPVEPPEIVIPLVETPLGGGDLPDTSHAIPWMNLVLGFFLLGIGYKNKEKC